MRSTSTSGKTSKCAYGFGIGTILYPIVVGGTIAFVFTCIFVGSALMGMGLANDSQASKRRNS